MNVTEQSFEILAFPESVELLELAGRVCYKSEPKGEPEKFVKKIINNKHLSVLEHLSSTVRLITDRGILSELTRHRIGIAFSVESTRYINYYKKSLEFIIPSAFNNESEKTTQNYNTWIESIQYAETQYNKLIQNGAKPEDARSILPLSLKTEMIVTANFREWLHIFQLRCSTHAHKDMRLIMRKIRDEFIKKCPTVFDVNLNENNN